MILNLHIHWETQNSTPFISVTIPIMNADNITFSVLIRSGIIFHLPKTVYANADIKSIKSIKSGASVEKIRILHFPASAIFNSMKHEDPKELHVAIERPKPAASKPINSLALVMEATKPTLVSHPSKLKVSDVINFQEKHEVATSKATFLKSLPRGDKPSLDDQYEALCSNYVNDLGLRCKKGSGEKEVIAVKSDASSLSTGVVTSCGEAI